MDDLRIKNMIKMDGWKNLFTGLGGKADKKTHTKARPDGFLLDAELETIYADDGLGANIIDFLSASSILSAFIKIILSSQLGITSSINSFS